MAKKTSSPTRSFSKTNPLLRNLLIGGGVGLVLALAIFVPMSLLSVLPFSLPVVLVLGVSSIAFFAALSGVVGALVRPKHDSFDARGELPKDFSVGKNPLSVKGKSSADLPSATASTPSPSANARPSSSTRTAGALVKYAKSKPHELRNLFYSNEITIGELSKAIVECEIEGRIQMVSPLRQAILGANEADACWLISKGAKFAPGELPHVPCTHDEQKYQTSVFLALISPRKERVRVVGEVTKLSEMHASPPIAWVVSAYIQGFTLAEIMTSGSRNPSMERVVSIGSVSLYKDICQNLKIAQVPVYCSHGFQKLHFLKMWAADDILGDLTHLGVIFEGNGGSQGFGHQFYLSSEEVKERLSPLFPLLGEPSEEDRWVVPTWVPRDILLKFVRQESDALQAFMGMLIERYHQNKAGSPVSDDILNCCAQYPLFLYQTFPMGNPINIIISKADDALFWRLKPLYDQGHALDSSKQGILSCTKEGRDSSLDLIEKEIGSITSKPHYFRDGDLDKLARLCSILTGMLRTIPSKEARDQLIIEVFGERLQEFNQKLNESIQQMMILKKPYEWPLALRWCLEPSLKNIEVLGANETCLFIKFFDIDESALSRLKLIVDINDQQETALPFKSVSEKELLEVMNNSQFDFQTYAIDLLKRYPRQEHVATIAKIARKEPELILKKVTESLTVGEFIIDKEDSSLIRDVLIPELSHSKASDKYLVSLIKLILTKQNDYCSLMECCIGLVQDREQLFFLESSPDFQPYKSRLSIKTSLEKPVSAAGNIVFFPAVASEEPEPQPDADLTRVC